ncbi:MAG: FHA domain-containing protein [Pseudonocardiales bacterium]
MTCPRCGQHNPEDGRFCTRCGAALTRSEAPAQNQPLDSTSTMTFGAIEEAPPEAPDSLAAAHARAVDALPGGSALLVVRRGPNAGSRFLLDESVTTAGRHPESDIFLDDVTVSRRHAEFRREGGAFSVRDVGSLNGTYVNRERIETAVLAGGDEVQIGKFRLVFLTGPRSSEVAGSGVTS